MKRLVSLDHSQIHWPFEGQPYVYATLPGSYIQIQVDPFPCYSHDRQLAEQCIRRVEAAFPVGFPVTWCLLGVESISRTNGWADRQWIYHEGQQEREWRPCIVLSGKRIPIHPAMTRYLVPHEYGHVVRWWILHQRGDKDEVVTDFDREYMELRGLKSDECSGYGGGKWHHNVGEILANDFRICVAKAEPEFWPHEVERPQNMPVVRKFWQSMVRKYRAR
jgi:hypothetical protein